MPKIITDLETRLLSAARNIIRNQGYECLSMKGLAKETDIAVGTIYNYYPDKNALLIALVEDDWKALEQKTLLEAKNVSSFQEGVELLHRHFIGFSKDHQVLFRNFTTNGNATYYASYRSFVEKGGELLAFLSKKFGINADETHTKMAASMFSYAIHYPATPFNEIIDAIKRLLQ